MNWGNDVHDGIVTVRLWFVLGYDSEFVYCKLCMCDAKCWVCMCMHC